MPAGFTRPQIVHTALVYITRKPGGYQRGAAIWATVKCFTHATPHPGLKLMQGNLTTAAL
jgi:hypothetical protein